jgi:hypothetical protein
MDFEAHQIDRSAIWARLTERVTVPGVDRSSGDFDALIAAEKVDNHRIRTQLAKCATALGFEIDPIFKEYLAVAEDDGDNKIMDYCPLALSIDDGYLRDACHKLIGNPDINTTLVYGRFGEVSSEIHLCRANIDDVETFFVVYTYSSQVTEVKIASVIVTKDAYLDECGNSRDTVSFFMM